MRTIQVEFDDAPDYFYTYLYDPQVYDLEVGDQVTVRGHGDMRAADGVKNVTVVGFGRGLWQGPLQTIIGVPEMEDDDEED